MTVFDNLRYISGNALEQRRVPRRCVTTAVKDIHINIQHQRNRTMTAEKNASVTIGAHQRPISGQTIRNRLHESGIKARQLHVGQRLHPDTGL